MPARDTQLILLHGYSDDASGFANSWIPILTGAWSGPKSSSALPDKRAALYASNGRPLASHDPTTFVPYDAKRIFPLTYQSLVNEVFIDDIAEGMNQLVAKLTGFDRTREFDVIVHSTGMLVLRAWLARCRVGSADERAMVAKLRHIVGLAPASFGSPLAHKGRSWLAHVFNGNHDIGPDFLSTGDMVLDALELGSRFTWDLAHRDVFTPSACYGGDGTPYLFTLCGRSQYTGLKRLVNQPGTDGVVRRSAVALNSMKLRAVVTGEKKELTVTRSSSEPSTPWLPEEDNHSTLLREPSVEAIGAVLAALDVSSRAEAQAWSAHADGIVNTLALDDKWQQLVVRAIDELGRPVADFDVHLEVSDEKTGLVVAVTDIADVDVHPYAADKSYRCFHVNHGSVTRAAMEQGVTAPLIRIEVTGHTGTRLVGYLNPQAIVLKEGRLGQEGQYPLFFPFTTTLLEVVLDRKPTSVGGKDDVIQLARNAQ